MEILITAVGVQRVAICPVAQRGTFIPNRLTQDFPRLGAYRLPMTSLQIGTLSPRVDASVKQNLRRVQVSDARD